MCVCVCVCVCMSIQAFHESLNGALSRMREIAKFLKERLSFYIEIWAQFSFSYFYFFDLSNLVCITFH